MASRGGGGGGGMSSAPACDPLSSSLDRVLVDERCYESNDGIVRRREALKNLNLLVKQWIQVIKDCHGLTSGTGVTSVFVQSVSLSRGMHWQDIDKIGGRVVTYGSYMLGISHQGADIDALCLAPQHITR